MLQHDRKPDSCCSKPVWSRWLARFAQLATGGRDAPNPPSQSNENPRCPSNSGVIAEVVTDDGTNLGDVDAGISGANGKRSYMTWQCEGTPRLGVVRRRRGAGGRKPVRGRGNHGNTPAGMTTVPCAACQHRSRHRAPIAVHPYRPCEALGAASMLSDGHARRPPRDSRPESNVVGDVRTGRSGRTRLRRRTSRLKPLLPLRPDRASVRGKAHAGERDATIGQDRDRYWGRPQCPASDRRHR